MATRPSMEPRAYPVGWLAHLVPKDGQAAVLVLELHLVLPHHLRLGIQVHADYATVGSPHHIEGNPHLHIFYTIFHITLGS